MNSPSRALTGAALVLAACDSLRSTEQVEPEHQKPLAQVSSAPAQTQNDLSYELSRREDAILSEIAMLGPNHPWAGDYRLESKTRNERILVAPTAGCLARSSGAGLDDVNWGTATEAGGWLTIAFEQPQSAAHRFNETYGLSQIGPDRWLEVIGAEGKIRWELDRSAVRRRDFGGGSYWAVMRRSPLGVAVRFENGAKLGRCFLSESKSWSRYRDGGNNSPRVIPLDPALAKQTGLQDLFPLAQLTGWVVEAEVDADLVLSLEDVRIRDVAGYAKVDLRAGSPLCYVTVMLPVGKDPLFREFVLYRVDDTELVPVLHARIFVGVRGNLKWTHGWVGTEATQCQVAGVRNPMGIWSWNGGESVIAADEQLQPDCYREPQAEDEWAKRPLLQWPHPLWVLFYWLEPK